MGHDTEIEAMAAVTRALEGLDEDARRRVLDYAASRFTRSTSLFGRAAVDTAPEEQRSEFESFADLFDAANPRTEKEKTLVAAYWTQICQNQPNFPAQTLNSSLKDLGHGVGNITDSLDSLKDEKPASILQLKKSGTSRQARKIYKLTQEGARRVRSMLRTVESPESH